MAFGEPVEAHYRLDQADVVLSLDADFLTSGPASLRLQREFAARRRPSAESPQMNRLYAVESTPTPTGATADHRLALRAVAGRGLRARAWPRPWASPESPARSTTRGSAPLAADLERAGGEGARRSSASRSRRRCTRSATRSTQTLGAVGTTVVYTAAGRGVARRPRTRACATSSARCAAGEVELLVIVGGEPRLRRAGRPRLRGGARQGAAAHPPRPLPRRDGASAATGTCRPRTRSRAGATLRAVDGTVVDRPAADRAALQRTISDTSSSPASPARAPSRRPTRSCASYWQTQPGEARLRAALEPRAPRRRRRRHGVRRRSR